jgi:hypothetical protein
MTDPKPITKHDIEKEDIGDRYMLPAEKVQSALEGLKIEFDEEADGRWTKSKIDKWFPVFKEKEEKNDTNFE